MPYPIDAILWFLTGSIFGVFLEIIWDIHKKYRRDKLILGLILLELNRNVVLLEKNKIIIQINNISLAKGKDTLDVLIPFQNEYWDVMVHMGIPYLFLKSEKNINTYIKLVTVYTRIQWTNEQIKSREDFKIYNKALSTYKDDLSTYNRMLGESFEILGKLLPDTINDIKEILKIKENNKDKRKG